MMACCGCEMQYTRCAEDREGMLSCAGRLELMATSVEPDQFPGVYYFTMDKVRNLVLGFRPIVLHRIMISESEAWN